MKLYCFPAEWHVEFSSCGPKVLLSCLLNKHQWVYSSPHANCANLHEIIALPAKLRY